MKKIAVIGGGYAGMAAAVRLVERGAKATVFEAAKILGGRARRIDYRDESLDNGQHILSGAYIELLAMMRTVNTPDGAYERMPLTLSLPPEFELRAPRLPGPLHLAWALLTARGLPFSARLAAVRLMRTLKATQFKVDAAWTVERLLAFHRQPAPLVDYLWRPLTLSALNTPLDRASAQIFVNVLRDALASSRAASDLLLPKMDFSALFPEPAAAWLIARGSEVRVGSRVRAIAKNSDQFDVTSELGGERFDSVIVAVGPHQLAALDLPLLACGTESFSYEPIYTIYLKYPATVPLHPAMAGRSKGHAQWFFDRHALSGSDACHGLVAAVISASGTHETLDHVSLAEIVHQELQTLTGPLPNPLWHKVIAEKFATFSCTPELHRPTTTTSEPGLFLAGDYVACDYPATLEAAVRNGINAAEAAIQYQS